MYLCEALAGNVLLVDTNYVSKFEPDYRQELPQDMTGRRANTWVQCKSYGTPTFTSTCISTPLQ